MLLYNTDGTVSDIVINGIYNYKVTSSLETPPTIYQATQASASNAIIVNATNAGSSSAVAYGLGYANNTTKSGWVGGISPKNK